MAAWTTIPWTRVLAAGALLAAGTLLLSWLDYQRLVRSHPAAVHDGVLAAGFLALGVWLGWRVLGARARRGDPGDGAARDRMRAALGISAREIAVLDELAAGLSNKEIARRLEVSPNTVKTHLANLFAKLGASRRTDALRRARDLGLLP